MSPSGFGASAVRLSHAATVLLGWRPDEFWSATPEELATAITEPGQGTGLDRQTIADLIRQFPDD